VVLQLVFHDLRAVANLTEMCVDTHQPTDSDEECDVIYNVQGGLSARPRKSWRRLARCQT